MRSYCKGLRIGRAEVLSAYRMWESKQAGKKNSWRVVREYGGADALVDEIASEIAARSLSFPPVARRERHEPTNGKLRVICVESCKQQVCDYLAVECMAPLLDARIGYYQVGSVDGKGQVFAMAALRRWAHGGGYFVKSDVVKCYPSIKPDLVMRVLRRYVRSPDVLYLCGALLATYGDGLDIGSYFSLKMSQLVLSFAYHHVEGLAKVRRGRSVSLVEHQLWNMDDMVLMSHDKRDLKRAVRSMEAYMTGELGLAIKPWKVCDLDAGEGIDMCGYVVRRDRVTVRKRLFIRGSRAFRRFDRRRTPRMARRCCSYWGWIKHSDSERFRQRRGIDREQAIARRIVSQSDRG